MGIARILCHLRFYLSVPIVCSITGPSLIWFGSLITLIRISTPACVAKRIRREVRFRPDTRAEPNPGGSNNRATYTRAWADTGAYTGPRANAGARTGPRANTRTHSGAGTRAYTGANPRTNTWAYARAKSSPRTYTRADTTTRPTSTITITSLRRRSQPTKLMRPTRYSKPSPRY